MNKYKSLAMNTIIFAVGSFGSKILVLFLTRLYTSNISPADSSTKELLEITLNFLLPIFTLSISSATMRYGLDKEYNKKRKSAETLLMQKTSAHTPEAGVGQTSIDSISKNCEDVNIRKSYTIRGRFSDCQNVADFQKIDLKSRDEFIAILKQNGLSIRQISRLTGVNYYTIQKI